MIVSRLNLHFALDRVQRVASDRVCGTIDAACKQPKLRLAPCTSSLLVVRHTTTTSHSNDENTKIIVAFMAPDSFPLILRA